MTTASEFRGEHIRVPVPGRVDDKVRAMFFEMEEAIRKREEEHSDFILRTTLMSEEEIFRVYRSSKRLWSYGDEHRGAVIAMSVEKRLNLFGPMR